MKRLLICLGVAGAALAAGFPLVANANDTYRMIACRTMNGQTNSMAYFNVAISTTTNEILISNEASPALLSFFTDYESKKQTNSSQVGESALNLDISFEAKGSDSTRTLTIQSAVNSSVPIPTRAEVLAKLDAGYAPLSVDQQRTAYLEYLFKQGTIGLITDRTVTVGNPIGSIILTPVQCDAATIQ